MQIYGRWTIDALIILIDSLDCFPVLLSLAFLFPHLEPHQMYIKRYIEVSSIWIPHLTIVCHRDLFKGLPLWN